MHVCQNHPTPPPPAQTCTGDKEQATFNLKLALKLSGALAQALVGRCRRRHGTAAPLRCSVGSSHLQLPSKRHLSQLACAAASEAGRLERMRAPFQAQRLLAAARAAASTLQARPACCPRRWTS